MHSATFRLGPKPPFDFAASVRFLGSFPATAGEQFVGDAQLVKAFREEGLTTVVRLVSVGTVEQPELVADVIAERPISQRAVEALRDRVGFWLSVDDDLTDFYKRADDVFAPMVDRLHGYHQVKFPSPLEILCWAILVQRTPVPAARTIKQRLVTQFGGDLRLDGVDAVAFPDLAQLRSLSAKRLERVLNSHAKATRLAAAVAAYAEAGEEYLRTADYRDVKRFLLDLPGIGPWSASFILIRGLGRTDEVPYDDEIAGAVARTYGVDPGPTRLRELAEPYGPWAGYWAHYLRSAS